ncbi:spore germination protein [Caldibacillus lycopersici]|uniref:Spore germination protein n=1 Tax=Perspicuibacillus lycopersici TaxID=1325689 RepID=A0AAE3IPW0_9BACI|nr:spore germination protein [Perspicuibacillus lycopersici]MCU9612395.1 spore germination protein [Perspicuibacillus lycopersici]
MKNSFFKKGGKDKESKDIKDKTSKKENLISMSKDYKKVIYTNEKTNIEFKIEYISSLVDEKIIQKSALPYLLEKEFTKITDIKEILPIAEVEISEDPKQIEERLFTGFVVLTISSNKEKFCFFSAQKEIGRNISVPEVEFSVIGPKEAFVETLEQNLNLIRKRLPVKELIVEETTVGQLSKTKVAIIYLQGVVDDENVNTVKQRINDIKIDQITDSSFIGQIISDNRNSPFPQVLDSERPDRVAAVLSEGKIAVIVDGSPHALIAPTTLIEFFSSFEDYLLNWILASFFRVIRLFAVAFSILVTPLYVATLTYHYELIPQDLLSILITSRRVIPFPPILEVLFLELTIELLREAGARLPTKVGQTIGIVGGIVIGTASVEAGLTSNVLLIFVALAALASFTTPVYRIGNTIRLLRFPFLLLAELWGIIGIALGFSLLLTHLIRLTSLGRPYLEPIYPTRLVDFKDSFIRLPLDAQRKRPLYLRSESPKRMNPKGNKKKDIDE